MTSGGVAALVTAAAPGLGPDDIWDVLSKTAHDKGDIDAEVTGHQRRINARDAVARALGVQVVVPDLRIDAPSSGTEVTYGEWVGLLATVTDYRGRPLPVPDRGDPAPDLRWRRRAVSSRAIPPAPLCRARSRR